MSPLRENNGLGNSIPQCFEMFCDSQLHTVENESPKKFSIYCIDSLLTVIAFLFKF